MHYSDYNNSDEGLRKAAEHFLLALRVGCGVLLLVFLVYGLAERPTGRRPATLRGRAKQRFC